MIRTIGSRRTSPGLDSFEDSLVVNQSRLVHPLVSTDAMATLTNIGFSPSIGSGVEATNHLNSRADSVSRYVQVVRTSIPLVIADLLALATSYLIATIITYDFFGAHYYSGIWRNLCAVCFCHVVLGTFLGLFPASGFNPVRELRTQVSSFCISFIVLVALNGLLGQVSGNEILAISLAFPITIAIGPPARFCTRKIVSRFTWWGERVVIIGMNQQGRSIYQFLEQQPQRGLKPLGIVDDNPGKYWMQPGNAPFEFLGTVDELVGICRKRHVHWVIAAVADLEETDVREILARGSLIPNLVVVSSRLSMPTIWTESFDAAGLAGVHIRDRLLFPFQRFFKRVADVVLAALLLILCIPLYLAVFAWVRSKSDGPVLFHHRRIGRSGQPFEAWKFRTMVPDAANVLREHLASNPAAKAEWTQFHKLKNDPRVIPGMGEFLRRTSLDELPQLWNVLIGEMSLVGPRPVYTEDEIKMYGELYALYLRFRPGLTGLWQVSGRNNTTFAAKVQLDTYYAMNWSLWLDYFILLRTIRTVLLREGSY